MWEYYMPSGPIRDKAYRGNVSDLFGAFIKNNKPLLGRFLNEIKVASGYKIHMANKVHCQTAFVSYTKTMVMETFAETAAMTHQYCWFSMQTINNAM